MSIRLVVSGERAQASPTLQQGGYLSLIKCLTARAEICIRSISGIPDGRYAAEYEGRGVNRDVYKFGKYVLKLETKNRTPGSSSNVAEAQSLQATAELEQTVAFYHLGDVTIEYPYYRGNSAMSCIMTVNGLLQGYGGVTYDKLLHQHGMSPLDVRVASFLVTAYRDLALMVIDGVQQNITYSDMHTANIATLKDPCTHRHGASVASIVVDAEGVQRKQCTRTAFNQCADGMLVDLELQCDRAPHESWKVLGQYMHKYANRIFRQHGQDDLPRVRELVISRFNELWLSFIHEYLPRPTTCHISVAKRYAEASTYEPYRTYRIDEVAAPSQNSVMAMVPVMAVVQPSSGTLLVGGRGAQVSLSSSSHDAVACRIDEVAAPAQNSVVGAWHYAETVLVEPSSGTMLVGGRGAQVSLSSSSHDAVACRVDEVAAPETISFPGTIHGANMQHMSSGLSTLQEPYTSACRNDMMPEQVSSSGAIFRGMQDQIAIAQDQSVIAPLMSGVSTSQESFHSQTYLSAPKEAETIASFSNMVPHGTAPHGTTMQRTEEIALATAVSVPTHVETEVETKVGTQWHYADSLRDIVGRNLALQRSSPFRGPGSFQQTHSGRLSWDDRVAMNRFEKKPLMTRDQCDDVGRLCHLMYHALHNVLGRCSCSKEGKPQRRAVRESEFMKYGMAMRVFEFLIKFDYSEKQWFSPSATYQVVQQEFWILRWGLPGHPELKIHGFKFVDEYERDFLAHAITVAFLSEGVLYKRERE